MSKFQEQLDLYKSEMKKLKIDCDESLLEKVAKGLGPSMYKNDASKVSGTDDLELERIDANYLRKKLGLPAGKDNMKAIKEVVATMGSSNKNKYRAIFYYLLCVKFKKQAIYK